MIFDAAALSLRNLFAPETRTVFWKTLGLTILVLIGLWFGLRESFMAFIMPMLQGFIPELPDWAGWLTFIFGILASIGLALGLLVQGLFFAPADLPQFGMNVTTLLVPLFALTALARRVIAPGTAYIDLKYAQVLALAGADEATAAALAADVMAFETRLAQVSVSSEQLSRDVSLYYNPVSVADADALTPNFKWSAFFSSQGLDAPAMFSLAQPDFHKEVSTMLADVPAATWQAYLRYQTVDGLSPFLSDAFAEENFNFYGKTLRGQSEMQPRWKRVLNTINGQMGEALGMEYVDVAFSPEAKERMQELVSNLSAALKTRIENLEWMSPETKEQALVKWASFTPKIGYPDKWRDWSGLQTSRDSFVANLMAAGEFNHKFNLAKIGQPVDKTEWQMSPQTVNAYYNPLANEIVFPAAILQPPFFDLAADDAVNYGGIGAVIGHEMIHGYDDQGSRFDATGNFKNWWTEADMAGFQERTGRLVSQFNEYGYGDDMKVNGNLTLGENIADLGGLAVAYDALQKALENKRVAEIDGYGPNQRFFMNWATVWRVNYKPEELKVRLQTDPHAPARFRAMGAPSNLPAFADAFGCKEGDPMVRSGEAKVAIW